MNPMISWQVAQGRVDELSHAERRTAQLAFWRPYRRNP
jgi:hypothetical protein